MKPEELKHYSATDEMFKRDLGVGVVTVYQLNNGLSYFVMGEYHNKGALSPTVGARMNKEQSMHQVINEAFERKRLGEMSFDESKIDENNIYYSINTKQNLARVTFLQQVKLDLSEEDFKAKYVTPMHIEAQHQRSVSEFFWKLDETVNPDKKESRYKFKSTEECSEAANKGLECMNLARFPVSKEIMDKLSALQKGQFMWDETMSPLEFYGKKGGRKYSELTGFYLISLKDLFEQLKEPKIKSGKTEGEKPTVYIEHHSFSKEEKWKRFFIFEDEIQTILKIISQLTAEKKNITLFKPNSSQIEELASPWKVEKINCNQFRLLDAPSELVNLNKSG